MNNKIAVVMVGLLVGAGCKSSTTYNNVSHAASPGQVEHVVLVWLKEPGDAAVRERIVAATKTFTQIPGVISARAGRAIPSTQPTVDASFDVGIVVTFKDRKSLEAYGPHPVHAKAAKEVIVPVMKAVKAYDIELE